MRYSRMGRDLGLTEEQVRANLMFASDKPGEPILATVGEADASVWFGVAPPDLSLSARARGADWLYTYLMTFYRDENRPFGANNLVYPDVAMPHALVDLQGVQARREGAGEDGHTAPKGAGDLLELVEPGSMSVAEYRRAVRDLVNFMVYVGEPAKLDRYVLGGWVLLFLLVFFVISRLLYKEYWKDVH
jgi:ubiquinol-cytochrome c reductase cytochrome c1 subunit